jgi:hypothetical protein
MDNYLQRKLGLSGLPLAYVVQETINLTVIELVYGLPTVVKVMIAQEPQVGMHYEIHNRKVWLLVQNTTHGGTCWSWLQQYQRPLDGRQAYLAIKTHYLGESYSTRVRVAADNTIDNVNYEWYITVIHFRKILRNIEGSFRQY